MKEQLEIQTYSEQLEYLDEFMRKAESGVEAILASDSGHQGKLRRFYLDHHEQGFLAAAEIEFPEAPGVRFVYRRGALRSSGVDKGARFAATIYTSGLYEDLCTLPFPTVESGSTRVELFPFE